MTAEQTVVEALKITGRYTREQLTGETKRIFDLVGLDQRFLKAYPHELDGGRRQRVGIGRALALNPKFIVCDEPVSALDVSIQAQILNLLMDFQQEFDLTYLFITHNMSVVRHISDSICVMYLGQLVETCETKELFDRTLHPYTKALLSAIPSTDIDHQREQILMKGELTSPINPAPRLPLCSPLSLRLRTVPSAASSGGAAARSLRLPLQSAGAESAGLTGRGEQDENSIFRETAASYRLCRPAPVFISSGDGEQRRERGV